MLHFFSLFFIFLVGEKVGEEPKLKKFKSQRSNAIKTNYPGLFYYIEADSKAKVWIARIKIGKIDTEQVVGRSDDLQKTNAFFAHQRRLELIAELKAGKSIFKHDDPTLDELWKVYKETKGKTVVRAINMSYFYDKHIKDALGDKKLKSLKLRDLQNIVDAMLRAGYKVSHTRNFRDIISNCYKVAIHENLIENNLAHHIEFPKFDNNRYFELADDLRANLVKAIENIPFIEYRAMFFLLLRGRRKGEILKLKWTDIDLENGKYVIQDYNSKTRERQEYYLDTELHEELKELYKKRDKTSLFLFQNKNTKKPYTDIPRRFWAWLKDEAGIEEMRIHDFRHLIGFTLVNQGVPLEAIGKALGHKKTSTTQKYSNIKAKIAAGAIDTYLETIKKK